MGTANRQIEISSLLDPTQWNSKRHRQQKNPSGVGLWVNENCDWMLFDQVDERAGAVVIDDMEYSRLDPERYAQLEWEVRHAKARAVMGRMCAVEYTLLDIRFQQIRKKAEELFGEATLTEAVSEYNRQPNPVTR